MPRNEFAPNFALMTDFDARPFTSTLYTTEGQDISLPSASQIVFDNPIPKDEFVQLTLTFAFSWFRAP